MRRWIVCSCDYDGCFLGYGHEATTCYLLSVACFCFATFPFGRYLRQVADSTAFTDVTAGKGQWYIVWSDTRRYSTW